MLVEVLVPLLLAELALFVLPRTAAPAIALLAIAASATLAALDIEVLLTGGSPSAFGGMLFLDRQGAVVLGLALGLGFLAALVSSQTETRRRRFYALLLAFTTTMALATMANNLGLLWASVEATTLSSALLVGHRRTRQGAEAAWKYVILASAGIAVALLGTLVLVMAARAAQGATLSWSDLMTMAPTLDPGLVRLALALAVIGYGTKAGLVPLHFWLPDAHSEAPSPISGLLSGVLLSCAVLALDRFARIAQAAGQGVDWFLLVFGAVSVLVGGLLVLGARNYKRMLAHHSVENMGLVTFALGVGTPLAIAGAYFHIVSHGVSKSLAFFSAGRVHHHTNTLLVEEAHGLLARCPASARALLVGLLALVGVPPFAPFASKFMVLAASVQADQWAFVVPVVLGLVAALVGAVNHASAMMPSRAPQEAERPRPVREPWSVVAAFVLLVAVNLVLAAVGPHLFSTLFAAAPVYLGWNP